MVAELTSRRCGDLTRAFSLIELVVVVFVIGVLASIAVPRFARSIARQRAEAAAGRVAADLGLARQQAVTSSASQTVTFYLASDSYILPGVQHLDDSHSDYKVDLTVEPYVARLISADFGGDAEVVFDIYGTPDSGGEVIVAVGGWQKTVTLDEDTGKATVN